MADPNNTDPRARATTAATPAPGSPAAAPTTGRAAPAPAPAPAPQGADAAHKALDQFHEAHMRNSALSQRTDLYNEAQGHLRALRETFAKLNPPSQVAENQDAFQGGSNNASV